MLKQSDRWSAGELAFTSRDCLKARQTNLMQRTAKSLIQLLQELWGHENQSGKTQKMEMWQMTEERHKKRWVELFRKVRGNVSYSKQGKWKKRTPQWKKQSKTTGKVLLGKSKNRPRDDNHLMTTLDHASLKCSLVNAINFNTGLGLQPRIKQEKDHNIKISLIPWWNSS